MTAALAHLVARRAEVYRTLDFERELIELQRRGLDAEQAERVVRLALVRRLVVRRTVNGRAVLERPADWRAELAAIDDDGAASVRALTSNGGST
jgi:hypothetical protein